MRNSRALIFLFCVAVAFLHRRPIAAEEPPQPSLIVTKRSAEDEAVYQAIAKRRAWKFAETPLSEVRSTFAKELGVNVAIDSRAFDVGGVTKDAKVSVDLHEASARTALDFVCRQLELDWTVRNGLLLITTPDDWEIGSKAHVYDVATIFPQFDEEGIEQPYHPQSLIDLITSVIAPNHWTDVGGMATINEYHVGMARGLVITQSGRDRVSLERLLSELARRRQALATAKHDVQPEPSPQAMPPDALTRVLDALDRKDNWNLESPTFAEFLAILEAKTGIDFEFDANQAEWIDGSGDPLQIPGEFPATSARAVLDLVLSRYDLTWTVVDDVVFVTDEFKATPLQIPRVYDVRDAFASATTPGKTADIKFGTVIDLITSTIDPTSWTDVGGTGAIQQFESGPLQVVVVLQTPQNHAAIAKLLADLRVLRAQTPAPPPNAIPARAKPIEPVAPEVGESAPTFAALHPRDSGDMTERSRRFAVKLYRELAAQEEGNVLVSPYSAFEALGMVYVGARGQTAHELAGALELDGVQPTNAAPLFGRLRRGLIAHANLGKTDLFTANRLWGQQDFVLQPDFIQTLNTQFDSTPELLDFKKNVEAARRINEWTLAQTGGKIAGIVDSSDLNESTRFILANALYFKAAWEDPFAKQDTRRDHFHAPMGEIDAAYMQHRARCGYAATDDLQLAALDYAGGRFSMVFLLPSEKSSLRQLEASLTSERLRDWLAALQPREVDLRLPKFRFETKQELKPILQSLGVTSLFDVGNADLSGISALALSEGLAIEKVRQKTYIEVDELGAEAAAVTATAGFGGGFSTARSPQRPVKFHAERPFLFLIRDDESGVILFLGRITNPKFPDKPGGR